MSNNQTNIIRQDINFLENPLWKTDNRDDRHKFTITLPSGKYVYKAEEGNIPDDTDALFLYYFLLLSQNIGRSTLCMTRYRVIKDLNFPINQKSYDRLKTCLERWAGVSVHFQGSFYVIKKVTVKGEKEPVATKVKRHVDKFFHILKAEIVRDEEGKGKKTGQIRIKLDQDFVKAIEDSMFIKHIDLSVFIALRTPFSRRLYEWLPKQFIKRQVFEIGIDKFFDKMRMTPTTYPSVIKRKLKTIETAIKRINKFDKKNDYHVDLKDKNKRFSFVFSKTKKQKTESLDDGLGQLTLPGLTGADPEDTLNEEFKIENHALFDILTAEFGISNNKAVEILKTKDEFYIQEVLDVVRKGIKAGKIKDIPGFTITALQDDYRRQKTKAEIEKEERQKRKKKAQEERALIEKLREEFDKQYQAETEKALNKLSSDEYEQLVKSFEKDYIRDSNHIIKTAYRKKGFEHNFIKMSFRGYAAEKLLPEEVVELESYASKKGYCLVRQDDGDYRIAEES